MSGWSPVDLIPGLWLGVLAVLLLAALRRLYDPVPGRIAAVFGLALLILFGASLFGGKVLLPLDNLRGSRLFADLEPAEPHGNFEQGDLIELIGPSVTAAREAWSDGRWPLWNARVGAGMPLLADPQAQVAQPLVLAAYPLPWVRAAAVTAALRVLLALAFTFLWLRRRGLGEAAALVGALAFGLGGFVLLWVGWPIASSAAWLPVALYAGSRVADLGGRRDVLLLGCALLGLLLGGHPETVAYALGLAAAFFLADLSRLPGGRGILLRRAGLAWLLAFAVAAPVLLPAVEYFPKTARAAAQSVPVAPSGWGARAEGKLLPLFAPNAFGNSRYVHYWGPQNTNEDASGFVGTVGLLAALLAVAAPKKTRHEILALAIAGLCVAVLAAPPSLLSLLAWGASLARGRVLFPLALCLAYLAAATVERYRRREGKRIALVACAVLLGALFVWAYRGHPNPEDPALLSAFRLGWLRWQMRFLILGAVLLLAATVPRLRRLAAAALVVAVFAELLLIHAPANPAMPRRLAFPSNPVVGFLSNRLEALRGSGPGYRMAALGRELPPNLASLYGLPDARVYNPMAPRAYLEALAPVIDGWAGESPLLGRPEDPLYARLGVKYLLAPPGESPPKPLTLAFSDSHADVWEVPRPRPRLFPYPPAKGSRLRIPRLTPQWITAEVELAPGQTLRSSLYQDGGWKVLVERKWKEATVADGPFVAVEAPVSSNARMDLLYRPRAFLVGLLLAAVGVAAGAVLLTPSPSADRSVTSKLAHP